MKKYVLFAFIALFFVSSHAAWAQYVNVYVKLTVNNGTVSWIEISGYILDESTNIVIYADGGGSVINKNTKGSIDLNEVWSHSGGSGTHYQVITIGEGAFSGCSGLTSITIPNSVTTIWYYAFEGCSGLTSVTIPNGVTSIEYETFKNCSGLTSVTIPNSVTSIGFSAFSGCSGLTSIEIPNSVTNIEYETFKNCSGLTSVTIPNSVTSIGGFAFYGCSGLTSIEIPNSVTTIEDYTFNNCSGLTSVTIPNSVTSIGYSAFYGCSGLTSVTIPNSVTSIDILAFSGCSGLTSIEISNSLTKIEDCTFFECSGLTSIEIPNSVTRIGNGAFWGCSGLTSVTIPNSVTSIWSGAFGGCSGLTSVTIPNSVTSIDNYAFYGSTGLTSIIVESGNTVYDSRNNCNAIIETATNTLIVGCKNTYIPSSVTSIGYVAFSSCSGLTSITIPNSVTSIGYSAFSGCSGLTSIISYITDVFHTESGVFDGCDNATLYVPKGLVDTYKSTADWNSINSIEEMPPVVSLALACNNKGKLIINGRTHFTNDLGEVFIKDGVENTFVFIPKDNCELSQVMIDGLDVTLSVENNQLTTKVHEGSKMIVIFDKTGYDVNGDGNVDISDVVALVNIILGQ